MKLDNVDLKVDSAGNYLSGKTIFLGVSGGIAAIESPKIARMLRRFGAEVKVFATKSSKEFVGKAALEWATGNPVIDKLSGLAEHIAECDAILVAPATLNTLNKTAQGIADDPLSTLLASALGKKTPIYFCPTMHESLWDNPILQANLEKLEKFGVNIIPARVSEGKMKIPHTSTIVTKVCNSLARGPLKNKKILITGGPTPAIIDDVRRITNKFMGGTSIQITKELYLRGANVKLILGKTGIPVPEYLDVKYHSSFEEYRENVLKTLAQENFDFGIFSAAVADYIPLNKLKGKTKSDGSLKNIPLTQTTKVINEVRENFPNLFMTTFKYEEGLTREQLINIAKSRLKDFEIVVANRKEDKSTDNQALIVSKEGIFPAKSKNDLAKKLAEILELKINP